MMNKKQIKEDAIRQLMINNQKLLTRGLSKVINNRKGVKNGKKATK